MTEKNTKVGVVVPTFNRKKHIKALLEQINEQRLQLSNLLVHCIVVVDGSNDGTIEIIETDFSDVTIVNGDGSWWYTKSMNKGFEHALLHQFDYVLTLNDDIVLDDNYLQSIGKVINDTKEQEAVVGSLSFTMHQPPKVFFSGVKDLIKWRFKQTKYHKNFSVIPDNELTGYRESKLLPGRGMLIPCRILRKLKGFDEYFVQYHSDGDFCLRALKVGVEVLISYDLKLYSHIGETAQASSFKKSSFRDFIKSFANPYSRLYIPQWAKLTYRHGCKVLWPITFGIVLLSQFKAHFFNKKVV